jgi:hypothetical protein
VVNDIEQFPLAPIIAVGSSGTGRSQSDGWLIRPPPDHQRPLTVRHSTLKISMP